MRSGTHLDTLSLMSIQHELAMNIGLSQQLIPMLRRIMTVCLRRLSVRRVYIFCRHDEGYTLPEEVHSGPAQSFYFYMPRGKKNGILKSSDLHQWLALFFTQGCVQNAPKLFEGEGHYYHTYPLNDAAVIVLERIHTPLPEELVNALMPVFERLRIGCQAAIEHERMILEVERRCIAEKRIEHLAYYDDLTDLPNRRELLARIGDATSATGGQMSALLYVGLDNFRDVNDSLGYTFGNELLVEISRQLGTQAGPSIHLARISGDKFGLLYREIGCTAEAARYMATTLAHTLSSNLDKPLMIKGRPTTISASIGIVLLGDQQTSPDTVISMASMAFHKARAHSDQHIMFFDNSMTAEVDRRLTLDTEMRFALKDEQFSLFLQPQVDEQGQLIGAETLIRWMHPDKGVISPADFIPVAEKSGFIVPLSEWVLKRACEMIKILECEGIITADTYLAVNLSAKQFHQADFVSRVLSILERTGVRPTNLELELTEGTLLTDDENSIGKMKALKDQGIRFSIDDFGTGYSSLAYLKRLPIDRIKIDRAFVMNVDNSPDDAAIIDSIISMANHFGLTVIAEGVETQSEYDSLKAMGCREFQGFLFHRPVPLEELIAQADTLRVASQLSV